jgi:hypothetical protein
MTCFIQTVEFTDTDSHVVLIISFQGQVIWPILHCATNLNPLSVLMEKHPLVPLVHVPLRCHCATDFMARYAAR